MIRLSEFCCPISLMSMRVSRPESLDDLPRGCNNPSLALLTAVPRLTSPQSQVSSRPAACAANRLRAPHLSCSVAFGSPPTCAISSQLQSHRKQLQSDTWSNIDKSVQLFLVFQISNQCVSLSTARTPCLEAHTQSASDAAGCRRRSRHHCPVERLSGAKGCG